MAESRRAYYLVGAALMVVAMIVALSVVAGRAAHATTTFHVNSTADFNDQDFPSGTFDGSSDGKCDADAAIEELCTLRAAIQQANVTAGADTIDFKIDGTGVKTITPSAANGPLPTITETLTINGYTQRPCASNPTPCSKPNKLAKGTNAKLLIQLNGTNAGSGADGLTVQAPNSVVKGLVINRFQDDGIFLAGGGEGGRPDADGSKIEGNFIGTNPAGTVALGNHGDGLQLDQTINVTIGGTTASARNLISGNELSGVDLFLGDETGASNNKVLGNLIGTDKGGITNLGNGASGVFIDGMGNNFIGDGTATGANTIAFNGSDGVTIENLANPNDANGNRILSNSIFANVGLGIDLGDDGPTSNDTLDPDSGPNTLQNKPIISFAKTTGTTITIKGKLNSTPNKTFRVQFYSNVASEPAGNEGRRFLGQKSVTTNANGNTGTFTRQLALRVPAGQKVTATASGPGGNTSEFSAPRTVVRQ